MQHAARFNSARGLEPAQDGDERGGFGCGIKWHGSHGRRVVCGSGRARPAEASEPSIALDLHCRWLKPCRVQARQVGRADEMHCRHLAQGLQRTGDVTRNQQSGKKSSCVARRELAGQRAAAAFKQPVQQLGARESARTVPGPLRKASAVTSPRSRTNTL